MLEERYEMFIGAIISTLSKVTEEKKSRYEDISRVLMGSKAYLLFEFQNIIVDVSFLINLTLNLDFKIHPDPFPELRRKPKHF
jgi:hypothetical protein